MKDGDRFRPSNGNEGLTFVEYFCSHCMFEHPHPDREPKCEIFSASFLYDHDDPRYPKEWCYMKGKPTCTKYIDWSWGEDDGFGGGYEFPPPDLEPDPNQLCLPFEMNEIIEQENKILIKQLVT